jgi:hypothetical protein
VRILGAIAGLVLILSAWVSATRTVFTPQEGSSHTALWIARLTGTVMLGIARKLPSSVREGFLGFACPLMLLFESVLWLVVNIAGFTLFAWGAAGIPLRAQSVGDFFALRSPADALSAVAWLCNALLLAAVIVHLARVTSAYGRREQLVCRLSAQATRSLDAENILAEYVSRAGGRARLGGLFGRWADWLADLQSTHLAYPALAHYRSSGEVCWAEAAQIMLDCAALAEACAPSEAPPEAAVLITAAERCFPRIAKRLGIDLPPPVVSYQGREARPFDRTLNVIRDAGAPIEGEENCVQRSFQRIRVRYAPFTNAICERLLYKNNDL